MNHKEYRQIIINTFFSVKNTANFLLHNGMSMAFCYELREVGEVLEPDDDFEITYDMLNTMEDPLIREIGNFVIACEKMLRRFIMVNTIEEEELADECEEEPTVEMTKEQKEEQLRLAAEFKLMSYAERYKELRTVIHKVLEEDTLLDIGSARLCMEDSENEALYQPAGETPTECCRENNWGMYQVNHLKKNIKMLQVLENKLYCLIEALEEYPEVTRNGWPGRLRG